MCILFFCAVVVTSISMVTATISDMVCTTRVLVGDSLTHQETSLWAGTGGIDSLRRTKK